MTVKIDMPTELDRTDSGLETAEPDNDSGESSPTTKSKDVAELELELELLLKRKVVLKKKIQDLRDAEVGDYSTPSAE